MNNKTYFTVTGAVLLVSIGFLILALRCSGDGGGAPSDKAITNAPFLPGSEPERPTKSPDDAGKNDANAKKEKTKIEKDESKN